MNPLNLRQTIVPDKVILCRILRFPNTVFTTKEGFRIIRWLRFLGRKYCTVSWLECQFANSGIECFLLAASLSIA